MCVLVYVCMCEYRGVADEKSRKRKEDICSPAFELYFMTERPELLMGKYQIFVCYHNQAFTIWDE